MRILVIGGTKFIGPHVVAKLNEQGHDVTIFNRGETASDLPQGVRRITGDRHNLAAFSSDFKRLAPDVVLDMILFNEDEARTLVQTFKGIAGRIVAPSSMDVYRAYGRLLGLEEGEPDPVPYSEEGPLREVLYPYRSRAKDADDYAYNYDKIPAERVLMNEAELPATILRLPAVHGPNDKQHRLFEYLKPMMDGRPVIMIEETKARWLWTRGYVENVADAIVLAINDPRSIGRIYNVGDPDTLSESDWVRSIARVAGWKGEVLILDKSRLPKHLALDYPYRHHLASDTRRIRAELGYAERITRDEGLRRTIEWERENPPPEIDPAEFDYEAEDAALAKLKEHA